jgi:hypothetical protein
MPLVLVQRSVGHDLAVEGIDRATHRIPGPGATELGAIDRDGTETLVIRDDVRRIAASALLLETECRSNRDVTAHHVAGLVAGPTSRHSPY